MWLLIATIFFDGWIVFEVFFFLLSLSVGVTAGTRTVVVIVGVVVPAPVAPNKLSAPDSGGVSFSLATVILVVTGS